MTKRVLVAIALLHGAAASRLWAKDKVVTVDLSSDSEARGYEAYRAMDGNPATMWHSLWGGGETKLPHDLVIDLGAAYEIAGFEYLPREGKSNGTIRKYEFYVSSDKKKLGEPVASGEFALKEAREKVTFPGGKAKGRFVCLRALSEVNGNQIFTSVAELKLLTPGVQFRGRRAEAGAPPPPPGAIAKPESEVDMQYNVLLADLRNRARVNRFAAETFHPASLVADADRDPLDMILRRTEALLADIREMADAPDLSGHAATLADFATAAKDTSVTDTEKRLELFKEVHSLRRQIAFANPLLDFDQLLFIKRARSKFNHMCDQYYGAYAVPGGGVFVLANPFGDEPVERDVLAESVVESGRLKGTKLDTGGFLSPELSYDGRTVYFAYVECTGSTGHVRHLDHENNGHWDRGRCYHLFSVKTDGSELRQLTDGTWNEFDPCPLPNGRVAFITERRGGYLRCGRACPSYTVYDMKPDGSDIRMLSPHENNEWHPSVDNDGMIIYTRWDYVDRHGCTAHHPWIMTPDGRDSRAMHGNFSARNKRPDMEMDLRAVPGSHKILGTAAPHHGQA